MDKVSGFFLDLIVIFIIVFLIYTIIFNRKRKNYKDLKKNDEIKSFIARYNLDMRKTEYKKLLKALTIINSFILSFTTSIVIRIDGFIKSLLIGFLIIMVLIYSLYEITGKYFKRKEEEKNVLFQKNRRKVATKMVRYKMFWGW